MKRGQNTFITGVSLVWGMLRLRMDASPTRHPLMHCSLNTFAIDEKYALLLVGEQMAKLEKIVAALGRMCSVMALLVLVQGCTTVPVTGRKQLNFVSTEQEMQLGLTSFEELKKETPINHDPALNALVQRVGKKIAQVASNDLPQAQWEFVVFDSPQANAFCLPGGKVGVYTGILPITQNEAGLATVIGHEVAHAAAHHGASRMSRAMITQGVGQAAGAALGSTSYAQYQDLFLSLYGVGTKVGLELPYDRAQESEADHIGLVYMARAGYDPREAVAFWERFATYNAKAGADNVPVFLRTHPLDSARIRQLKEWLPEAEAVFARSGSK